MNEPKPNNEEGKWQTQSDRPEERMQNRNIIRDARRAKEEAMECAEICHYA